MDSVPPETPIRDVVHRRRVWESHADPDIRRVSKPGPEPIYLAYVVGDSDNVVDEIWVAAVTKPKSTPDDCWRAWLPRLRSSSGSGGSDGGKVAAASGCGESPACARDSTRAGGIGKLAQIVPIGAADIGTAASAETHQAGLEWHCVFFMRKGGS